MRALAAGGAFRRSDGAVIAYRRAGAKDRERPGVVFLHGLKSDMGGTKAEALSRHAAAEGHDLLRYDMFGHRASSGRFEDGGISHWTEDAVAILDELTVGPQVLVGSSMGGWVMVKAATARPDRMKGMVGVAVAPGFTEDLMWAGFTPAEREALRVSGAVDLPGVYADGPTRISRHLIEDGRRNLVLRSKIPVACPLRLLHGQRDASVPWQTSLRLAEQFSGDDVAVHLIKDGDHRLSRPQDLDRLPAFVGELVGKAAS